MGELLNLAVYNPAILDDQDFLASFVARQDVMQRLLQRLAEIQPGGLAQHHVILGQRGMGKTSLLRRLALAIRDDPALSAVLLPLCFREEQYNVHNLRIFWCNCLDALADWFEKAGRTDQADAIDREIAQLAQGQPDPHGDVALACFKRWAKAEGKRPLLLLDNIDLVLNGLGRDERDQWSLRRVLQEAGGIVVVSASATYLEAAVHREAAFYDFFQVTVLEPLTQDDLLACLRRLAQARGEEGRKVCAIVDGDPGRIRTLHDLTGGNPRTLILLYLLLELDADGDVISDLERLLDQVTVLYKARVEDLPPQGRVILDAVALAWNPVVATEVATAAGLEITTVSAQLDRLHRDGIVDKLTPTASRRTAYQLSERFFNIWYLMRHGPRRQRTRLRWLTGFLRSFYSPKQLNLRARDLLRDNQAYGLDRGQYSLALGDAVEDVGWRNALGEEARKELERHAAAIGKRLQDIVDPEELPTPRSAHDWVVQGKLLAEHLERYAEAEAAYHKAIELDPAFAKPWNGLGYLLHYRLGRFEEAEGAFRKAIQLDAAFAWPWNHLGNLLHYSLGRFEEAEAAYRKAIEIDPAYARPWHNLGYLLHHRLGRFEEAEAAFRKAIQLDAEFAWPWNHLGNLLHHSLGRSEEAEAAYRKAIELDPAFARPWNHLGNLLHHSLGRFEEAEAAYRKAIELDPAFAWPWNDLGDLLHDSLGRFEEAEAAYRKAIQLDPAYAAPWNGLGHLLHNRLDRFEEAEAALRKAVELDPKEIDAWCGLGFVCLYFLGRYDDAEAAYQAADQLAPADLVVRSNLLALHIIRAASASEVDAELAALVPQHPPHGAALLQALRALSRDNFGVAAQAFEAALAADQSDVLDVYLGFLVLLLRQAASAGYGDKLRARMDDTGLSDRYWPLRAAFDAYLHGEEKLAEVNPEVRGAAKRIYAWLDGARSQRATELRKPKPARLRRRRA